jgi:WD40 repeat protein
MVWSVTGRRPPKKLPAGLLLQRVGSIAFDTGAKKLAVAGLNYFATVYETEGWTEAGCIGHMAALAVVFSPDGHWLLTSGPLRVVAWDLATAMRPLNSCGFNSDELSPPSFLIDKEGASPYFLSFSKDGHWLAEGGGVAAVTPAKPGAGFSVSRKAAFGSNAVVAINPDASLVATRVRDGEFVAWQFAHDHTQPVVLVRILLDGKKQGSTVAFGPTGKWVVSAGDRLERWHLAAGAEWARLPHDAGVRAVAVSPNGRYVATTTVDGFAQIWQASDWTRVLRTEIRSGKADPATSNIAFSSDGLWLAATSDDVLKIFSANRWREMPLKEYEHNEHNIARVRFSPDARWVVTVEDDGTRVGVIAIDSWQATHIVHGSGIDALSISPDGRWLLTKTDPWCYGTGRRNRQLAGVARVWRIADGEPQASMPVVDKSKTCHLRREDEQEGPRGKIELIRDLANWINIPIGATPAEHSSPNGRWLAERGGPDSIELKASDAPDRPGIPHRAGGVIDMAFSREGRWLVTTSLDGAARVWALNREDMIAESCARLTHDLSEDDWHHFLGKESFIPVCQGLPPLRD